MKVAYASVLALASAVANAQSSGPQSVETFINQTIKDIGTLNTTLNGIALTSSDFGFQVFGLLSGSNALVADIGNTTQAATSSSAFGTSSADVFASIFNLVTPTVQLLDNFVRHCPAFARAGLQPTVAQQLTAQLALVNKESAALADKLSAPYNNYASTGSLFLTRAFSQTLAVFGGPLCNTTSGAAGVAAILGQATNSTSSTGTTGSTGGSAVASSGAAAMTSGSSGSTGGAVGGASSAAASITSSAAFTPLSIAPSAVPTTFTGAAPVGKRSPLGSFLNLL